MTLRVGLTYNSKRQPSVDEGVPEDYYAEYDDTETVDAIADALRTGGCTVFQIEADESAYAKLSQFRPDIVFNIAEGLHGESRRSQIPAMLEMLRIPYTGSGPLTLATTLDKGLTHRILRACGIPSPAFQIFRSAEERRCSGLAFPLVVKPLSEGSSKGVRSNSLVRNDTDLSRQVSWVIENYAQPAIAEEFLPGREFTVGLLGNKSPLVLPIVEVLLERLPKGANPLYSYEAKWIWDVPEKPLDIFRCPAEISGELKREIETVAVKTFETLGCRDVCRMDMRLNDQGVPNIIEVNPLPGMIPDPDAHSCMPEAAHAAGFAYDQLICTILWYALGRYGLLDLFERGSLIRT